MKSEWDGLKRSKLWQEDRASVDGMSEVRLVWLSDFLMRCQSVRKSSVAPGGWEGWRAEKVWISDMMGISTWRRTEKRSLQKMESVNHKPSRDLKYTDRHADLLKHMKDTSYILRFSGGCKFWHAAWLAGHIFVRRSKRPHMPAQSTDDIHAAVTKGIWGHSALALQKKRLTMSMSCLLIKKIQYIYIYIYDSCFWTHLFTWNINNQLSNVSQCDSLKYLWLTKDVWGEARTAHTTTGWKVLMQACSACDDQTGLIWSRAEATSVRRLTGERVAGSGGDPRTAAACVGPRHPTASS